MINHILPFLQKVMKFPRRIALSFWKSWLELRTKMVSSLTFPSWTNCVASKWISYYILHIRTSFQTAQNIMCYKHPSLFTHMGGLKPDSKNGPNLSILVSNNTHSKWHKKVWELEVANFLNYFTVRQ